MMDAHGKIERYLAIRFDVTEIKHKEHEKEILRKQLEDAQRVAKIGSWSVDATTQKITWSKQMFELFDKDRSLGAPSFKEQSASIHSEDRPGWLLALEKCLTD